MKLSERSMTMKNEAEKYLPSNVFEGLTSIRAIIKARDEGISERQINEILYDASRKDKYAREIAWLERIRKKHGFTLIEADSGRISELTLGTSHGGFVALCGERPVPELTACDILENGFYILLDGIEDPYNFGSAVRSAYAAGADGIVLPPRNWMSAAGIVCRSSAGATELAPLFSAEPSDAIDLFRSRGYKIVAAAKENAVSMYDVSLRTPVLVMIGGEMRGISKKLMAKTDVTVRIDYGRDFPAALSAQSSAAVIAFEVYRQNHAE